jgi:F0F1-type ATP synthase assembly protein I
MKQDNDLGSTASKIAKAYREAGPYMGLGLQLVAPIIGLTLLGWWLDETNHTKPLWTIIGAAVGSISGFYSFIKTILQLTEKKKQEHAQKTNT